MRDECRSVPVERADTEHRFSPRERREEKRKPPEEERSRKAPRKFVQLSRDEAREREREKQKNTDEEKERKEDGKRYKHSQRSLRASARASSGPEARLSKGTQRDFTRSSTSSPRADDGRTHNQRVNPNNRARDKRWAITNKPRPEQERERERD